MSTFIFIAMFAYFTLVIITVGMEPKHKVVVGLIAMFITIILCLCKII